MAVSGTRNGRVAFSRSERPSAVMTDFNRKVEEASARINRSVADVTANLEEETAQLISYLNNEVVPAVRQHSTKALRIASEKLSRMADYMEKHHAPPK